MGGSPPSKPVASTGSGQNNNFSVANKWKGDMEVQSTPYVISLIEDLNDGDLKLEDIVLLEVAECRMINDALETE